MAFDIQEGGTRSTEFDQPDEQTLSFEMNLDLATAEREVFHILNWVATLGGLNLGLRTLFSLILAVATYKNYEVKMVQHLFDNHKGPSKPDSKEGNEKNNKSKKACCKSDSISLIKVLFFDCLTKGCREWFNSDKSGLFARTEPYQKFDRALKKYTKVVDVE